MFLDVYRTANYVRKQSPNSFYFVLVIQLSGGINENRSQSV